MEEIESLPYSFSDYSYSSTARNSSINGICKTGTIDIGSILEKMRELHIRANSKNLSHAERIQLEGAWTDIMIELLRFGNIDILKSFRYRLEMEQEEKEGTIS